MSKTHLSRRLFLTAGLAGLVGSGLIVPPPVLAAIAPKREAKLALANLHTGEQVSATFWADGRFVRDGIAELNYCLRDHRTDEEAAMDPVLYLLLHRLKKSMQCSSAVIEVISGYRSPKSNALLSQSSSGVAKSSYHVKGKAIDLRIQGQPLKQIRNAALSLGGGGVGYYPKSKFVHIDTGPVRQWKG